MLTMEAVPENELDSRMLERGPILCGVAGGSFVNAIGVWGCLLPLADGGYQVVRTLTMPQVTADMPEVDMNPAFKGVEALC